MEDVIPENVMFDVISRLPVKSVIYCKCVCKKWRDLVSDPYFVHLHLSRSREALMMIYKDSLFKDCGQKTLEWVEIENEVDYQRLTLNYVKILNLNLDAVVPGYQTLQVGSVNGLIMIRVYGPYAPAYAYLLNPVLGEYMIIPQPRLNLVSLSSGFGVSKAGEYNVIRICASNVSKDQGGEVEIEVYTLGLITETFELFPSPPRDNQESNQNLGVLKGRLSRFSLLSLGFTVWVMKESWCKEIAMIQENINPFLRSQGLRPMCLIDGLEGTSILIIKATQKVVAYCLNTNTIIDLINLSDYYLPTVTPYRPSFVSLQNFGSERGHFLNKSGVSMGGRLKERMPACM